MTEKKIDALEAFRSKTEPDAEAQARVRARVRESLGDAQLTNSMLRALPDPDAGAFARVVRRLRGGGQGSFPWGRALLAGVAVAAVAALILSRDGNEAPKHEAPLIAEPAPPPVEKEPVVEMPVEEKALANAKARVTNLAVFGAVSKAGAEQTLATISESLDRCLEQTEGADDLIVSIAVDEHSAVRRVKVTGPNGSAFSACIDGPLESKRFRLEKGVVAGPEETPRGGVIRFRIDVEEE